ncbi:Rha family transcriptional regulator [Bacteroides sp. GD17]|uniref:Rha family transcriptional regulator n=1 Tax=Bacteroides sp. GD17 TaxID=3139826 RepID=UPI00313D1D49
MENFGELVFKGENCQALTNSILVAGKFGKEPNDVVRSIDNLLQNADNECNVKVRDMFVEYTEDVPQPNGGVKTARRFIMNRDGFTLLAMGFTGKKALKFKLDYIAAFNAMEKALKEQQSQKPLSSAQMFAMQANINLEYEQRISNVEKRLDAMEQEREENGKMLLTVTVSPDLIPQMSVRDNIRQLVNRYANATNTKQRDIWHKIYDQLYYLYHISVKAYKKEKKETYLDVAERNHFLDKIYSIISNLIREKGIA